MQPLRRAPCPSEVQMRFLLVFSCPHCTFLVSCRALLGLGRPQLPPPPAEGRQVLAIEPRAAPGVRAGVCVGLRLLLLCVDAQGASLLGRVARARLGLREASRLPS